MLNVSPSPYRVWITTMILIICIIAGYILAMFISGEALGKAPLQCPAARCQGEDCPHQKL